MSTWILTDKSIWVCFAETLWVICFNFAVHCGQVSLFLVHVLIWQTQPVFQFGTQEKMRGIFFSPLFGEEAFISKQIQVLAVLTEHFTTLFFAWIPPETSIVVPFDKNDDPLPWTGLGKLLCCLKCDCFTIVLFAFLVVVGCQSTNREARLCEFTAPGAKDVSAGAGRHSALTTRRCFQSCTSFLRLPDVWMWQAGRRTPRSQLQVRGTLQPRLATRIWTSQFSKCLEQTLALDGLSVFSSVLFCLKKANEGRHMSNLSWTDFRWNLWGPLQGSFISNPISFSLSSGIVDV